MSDTPITISSQIAVSIAVAVLALLGTGIGGVFKLMQSHVNHWKEMFDAKKAELAEILENPNDVARDYIASYRTLMEQQIKETEGKIVALKGELAKRDQIIATMTAQTKENEQKLVFHIEVKEELERTIVAYEEFVTNFNAELSFAHEVISAFDRNEFDEAKIKVQLEELERKIDIIKASSLSKFRNSVKADVNRAAAQKAATVQEALRKKKEVEEKVKAQMTAAIPLPTSAGNSSPSGKTPN